MDEVLVFLRARLDEDELTVREANTSPEMVTGVPRSYAEAPVAIHIARFADPARVLREVEAKRSAIREAFRHAAAVDGEWGCCHDAEQIERGECEEEVPSEMPILQALASVYADHPDYRPEWAPSA